MITIIIPAIYIHVLEKLYSIDNSDALLCFDIVVLLSNNYSFILGCLYDIRDIIPGGVIENSTNF